MNSFFQDYGRFQTAHPQMKRALEEALHLAPTTKPIFIVGPASSGKKELALMIHENSSRSRYRIVRWSDKVEIGNDDTVLVDRWESLPMSDKAKIAAQVKKLKARWIFTSQIPIVDNVFNSAIITLPAFSERKDDHLIIAEELFTSFSMIKNKKVTFDDQAKAKISNSNWGSSYSEFEAFVEKVFLSEPIHPGMTLSEMEKKLILQTLEMTKQNRTKAAEILGISIRTLRNKLSEYREEGVFS